MVDDAPTTCQQVMNRNKVSKGIEAIKAELNVNVNSNHAIWFDELLKLDIFGFD